MSGIHILPNFEVKTGGEMSLRVVTLDFLRQRGFDPTTGFGFTKEQSDRYGGKKLKLYKVFKLDVTAYEDHYNPNGATRRLSFSEDGNDSYKWNEYMLQEYWDAIGQGPVARAPTPKSATKSTPKPAPTATPPRAAPRSEPHKVSAPVAAPKKRKSNSMMKMLILMSILNQPKAAPAVVAVAKPKAKPAPNAGDGKSGL
jgi:hypothetical protein